ncbi:FadR family transcriptional regulator [Nocardioides eburneiflavus]|uniref:FadR family transcriptional regulator n=1 Tax=Nocardioides eburneiflavus TaxID=2518372 RepID=A0A4Z1CET4_9ACTN|nr:GntR family transcriptional regulator [Nocardioides eburneiflavus]TGN63227.1 FadR family transcriptional regulator [Nocardioides eburneiflavus]
MPLSPVARRSVPDEVYDQLVGEMLGGDLAAGEPLPSERRLAEVLGVSRPAVREALQRLASAGFVDVRQGGSTTVRDFRRLGGLDLLPRLLLAGGGLDLAVARSILEARAHVGPRIAELAAARGGPEAARLLDRAVAELAADDDGVRRQHVALVFWEHLVEAADSITFRLMFNSMRAAYVPLIEALAPLMAAEVDRVEAYAALAEAVRAGDADLAGARAGDLLGAATTSLVDAIDRMQAGES